MKKIFVLAFILSGCGKDNSHLTQTEIKQFIEYVTIENDYSFSDNTTKIKFWNSDKNCVSQEQFNSKGDLSYAYLDEQNENYYVFGPGGLLKISIEEFSMSELSTKDINDISVEDQELYFYENIGMANADSSYESKICSLQNEMHISLDFPVNDFIVYKDNIYVSNARLRPNDKTKIMIYSQGKLVKEIPVETAGTFYEIDDKIYFATTDYLLDVENNKTYEFSNENNEKIIFNTSYNMVLNLFDELYLINHEPEEDIIYYVSQFEENLILQRLDSRESIRNAIAYHDALYCVNDKNQLLKLHVSGNVILNKEVIDLNMDSKVNYVGFEIR